MTTNNFVNTLLVQVQELDCFFWVQKKSRESVNANMTNKLFKVYNLIHCDIYFKIDEKNKVNYISLFIYIVWSNMQYLQKKEENSFNYWKDKILSILNLKVVYYYLN